LRERIEGKGLRADDFRFTGNGQEFGVHVQSIAWKDAGLKGGNQVKSGGQGDVAFHGSCSPEP